MAIYRKTWITYIVFLHILLAIVLWKSDFIEQIGSKLGLNASSLESSTYYNLMTRSHSWMDGSVPSRATIFIGDSIIQGLATSAVSDLSVNYGIGWDTTEGLQNRLPIYQSISAAKAVVISIGINDLLAERDNESILRNYQQILEYMPQTTRVVVSAILPLDEGVRNSGPSNELVSNLNSLLKELATNYENTVFFDSAGLLTGEDGNLRAEFHGGDGLHLSTSGYGVWIEQLRASLDGVRN